MPFPGRVNSTFHEYVSISNILPSSESDRAIVDGKEREE
jgi:hypothetical protein